MTLRFNVEIEKLTIFLHNFQVSRHIESLRVIETAVCNDHFSQVLEFPPVIMRKHVYFPELVPFLDQKVGCRRANDCEQLLGICAELALKKVSFKVVAT